MTAKWCKHCRQHVADAQAACPQCGQLLSNSPASQVAEPTSDFSWAEDPAMPPALSRLAVGEFSFDSWELDQDLLDAERLIATEKRQQQKRAEQAIDRKKQAQAERESAKKRLPAHLRPDFATIQSLATGSAGGEYAAFAVGSSVTEKTDSFAAWCSRAMGWTMVAFGIVLTAASWLLVRGDLSRLGLPVAILGLAGIIVGRLLRPQPSRAVPAPMLNPYAVPPPLGLWAAPGQLTQAFFPPGYGPMMIPPPPHESQDSQRMLAEMKAQIEQLSAKLEQR